MGYGSYTITRNGLTIEAGYNITASCDQPDCATEISRGLDALCGDHPGGNENGCGRFFCDRHLHIASDGEQGYLCETCYSETDEDGRRLPTAGGAR